MDIGFVVVDPNTSIPEERLSWLKVLQWLFFSVAVARDCICLDGVSQSKIHQMATRVVNIPSVAPRSYERATFQAEYHEEAFESN